MCITWYIKLIKKKLIFNNLQYASAMIKGLILSKLLKIIA